MAKNSILCSRCQSSVFRPRLDVNTSELNTKLRAEFGPAAFDSKEVEELLLLSKKDIEDYEAEIVRLESQIVQIRGQQTRLRRHTKRLQSLSSPIRKLPNELLSRIFAYACESNLLQEYPWNCSKSSIKPPTILSPAVLSHIPTLALSSVCARWRLLILSCPDLWARMKLEISLETISPSEASDGFISTLELFLKRSGNAPLMLDLSMRGLLKAESDPLALCLLTRHTHRWKSFKHHCLYELSSLKTFKESVLDFSHLESLQFGMSAEPSELDCFQRAPKLRSLAVLPMSNSASSTLPWHQLAFLDVEIETIGQAAVYEVLNKCSSLSTLRLTQTVQIDAQLAHGPFDRITRLTLNLDDSGSRQSNNDLLKTALAAFTLPSLDKLEISSPSVDPDKCPWPKTTFRSFLLRSSCNLTSFSVDPTMLSDQDLIATIQLLPSLLKLTVRGRQKKKISAGPVTSRFVSSLHSSELTEVSNSVLLPKLRCLSLESGVDHFDDADFIGMVSSRWLPDAAYASMVGVDCLRSVEMHFHARKVDEDVYKPLRNLDKMGMRVVITGI